MEEQLSHVKQAIVTLCKALEDRFKQQKRGAKVLDRT